MQKPDKFPWAAGGFDKDTREVEDLAFIQEPPNLEDVSGRKSVFLEKLGYRVRHRLSQKEIETIYHGLPPEQSWVCLQPLDLQRLYARHCRMIRGANKMLTIARSWTLPLPKDAPEIGIAWWVDEDGCDRLSDNAELGLRTAVQIAGLQVDLYSYKQPVNLPAGVAHRNAADIVPLEEYNSKKLKGFTPPIIADLGRLRGIRKAIQDLSLIHI